MRISDTAKLKDSKGLPKFVEITDPKEIDRLGGTRMVIAPPMAYDEVMRSIPEGSLATSDLIRRHLAMVYGADFTCPLTAGIFINIVARASAERGTDPTPYWRTLKRGGELNEKYPGGLEGHRALLEAEGHTVVKRGQRYFVQNYEARLHKLGS